MRHTNDSDKKISNTCTDCDSTPIQCDFSGTVVETSCDSSSIAGIGTPESTWKTLIKRKMDPQATQSLLEKLTTKNNQMLEKHGIHS